MTEHDDDKPVMRGNRRVLCHIDEVSEAGKGFTLHRIFKEKPEATMPIFLIPDGADIHCYSVVTGIQKYLRVGMRRQFQIHSIFPYHKPSSDCPP